MSFSVLIRYFLFLLYAWFGWLMLQIMLQYIPWNSDAAFLGIKQDALKRPWYEPIFVVHVFSSILLLPLGFFQFSSEIRKRFPGFHRMAGRMYVLVTLIFVAPSGFFMGLVANGGWTAQLAFCLLAIFWFWTTWNGWLAARRKQWMTHRNWMIRSYALMLSAITLRTWKVILVFLFHPHPMDVYRMVAWLGWVLNWIVAEGILLQLARSDKKKSGHSKLL